MSETLGNLEHRDLFQNYDEIRRTNVMLKEYYAFLESLWPEATVIRFSEDPLFFTDCKYEYGAVTSHLNELLNQKLVGKNEQL